MSLVYRREGLPGWRCALETCLEISIVLLAFVVYGISELGDRARDWLGRSTKV